MCRETNVPIGWSKTRHVLLLPGFFFGTCYTCYADATSSFILIIEQRGILLRMRQ